MGTSRHLLILALAAVTLGLPGWSAVGSALAQSPVIALRTSGSIVRPGDCLRLEALALDDVSGPLSAQVTYRYTTRLVVKDKDGAESASTKAAEVRRPAGPLFDALNRMQLHLLDDTLCFGQGGTPGAYDVEVALRSGASGPPFATLRTCVMFEDPDVPAGAAGSGCGFLVRGLKRAETEDFLVFDADLPPSTFYRGAILRGGTVEAVLDAGITQTGPHELSVLVPAFNRSSGGAVDLVIVDQFGKASSTVARLPVPPAR
jgi:hypothetical protein